MVPSDASETRSPLLPSNLYFIIVFLSGFSNSGIDSATCLIQSAVEAPIFKNRCNSEMSKFLGLSRTCGFRLLHSLFRIYTQDQPHRHVVAIRQSHNYIRDLPRIAFRTPFQPPQYFEHRADRGLVVRQHIRRILTGAPCPVGPNTSRLQCADLDSERRHFQRQGVAETAHSPLGRVVRRIARNREATTDRRDLKDVTALLLAHHWHGSACC